MVEKVADGQQVPASPGLGLGLRPAQIHPLRRRWGWRWAWCGRERDSSGGTREIWAGVAGAEGRPRPVVLLDLRTAARTRRPHGRKAMCGVCVGAVCVGCVQRGVRGPEAWVLGVWRLKLKKWKG